MLMTFSLWLHVSYEFFIVKFIYIYLKRIIAIIIIIFYLIYYIIFFYLLISHKENLKTSIKVNYSGIIFYPNDLRHA